jgi:hypothetical protein
MLWTSLPCSKVLEALQAVDVGDRVRQAAETVRGW